MFKAELVLSLFFGGQLSSITNDAAILNAPLACLASHTNSSREKWSFPEAADFLFAVSFTFISVSSPPLYF